MLALLLFPDYRGLNRFLRIRRDLLGIPPEHIPNGAARVRDCGSLRTDARERRGCERIATGCERVATGCTLFRHPRLPRTRARSYGAKRRARRHWQTATRAPPADSPSAPRRRSHGCTRRRSQSAARSQTRSLSQTRRLAPVSRQYRDSIAPVTRQRVRGWREGISAGVGGYGKNPGLSAAGNLLALPTPPFRLVQDKASVQRNQ
jgi:hypothetical protein